MYDLMLYSLKTGACLAVFYLFYKLLLSRETFHRFNRVLLLAMLVLSFVLPCCVVTVYRDLPVAEMPVVQPDVLTAAVPTEAARTGGGFPWQEVLGILFVAGAAVVLLWVVFSHLRVWSIVRSGRSERLSDGMVLVRRPEAGSPFSWGRYVVVSEQDDDALLHDVLLHEEAHLRLRHSVDLLVTDLAGSLQWFNPAMWLLRRELRAIHEYEADEAVLRSGVDAREYQMLLIRKAAGRRWCSVANSFNHSKLKNRITMMLRKKSSRWNYARALVFLPLVGLALGAFAETVYRFPVNKGMQNSGTFIPSAVGNGASAAELVDRALRDAQTEAGLSASEGLAASAQAELGKPATRYFIDGREVTASALDTLDVSRIASMSVDKSGDNPASSTVRITLRADGAETQTLISGKGDRSYVYIVDGKRVAYSEIDLKPSEIATVKVIKDPSVIEQFDRPEVKGVVYILTTDFARQLEESLRAGAEGLEAGRAGLEAARVGLEAARQYLSGDEWKKVQQQLSDARQQLEQARRELDNQQTEASLEAARQYLSSDEWKAVQQQLREASEQLKQAQRELDGQRLASSSQTIVITDDGTSVSASASGAGSVSTSTSTSTSGSSVAAAAASGQGMPKGEPIISVKGGATKQMSQKGVLWVIDGKEYRADKMAPGEIDALVGDPSNILSISILKDASAREKYGRKARNGAIIVETRK